MTCIGQLIGLVVAKTRPLAQHAAQLVKIDYKDLPAIITIEVIATSVECSWMSVVMCVIVGCHCCRIILYTNSITEHRRQ